MVRGFLITLSRSSGGRKVTAAQRSPRFSLGDLIVPKFMSRADRAFHGFGIVVRIVEAIDYYTYFVRFQRSQRLLNYSQGGIKLYGS